MKGVKGSELCIYTRAREGVKGVQVVTVYRDVARTPVHTKVWNLHTLHTSAISAVQEAKVITALYRPHPYRQRSSTFNYCVCGRIRAHRSHQPLWWRIIHPAAKWR